MCTVGKMQGMRFWQEFIELYKSEPCLWQIKHEKYKKSQYKNRAYERLLEKFKEFDPDATMDCLKRKINGLRTCYRREFMKQKRSIESGAVGDDIYEPKLWYYESLSFLRDQVMETCELTNTLDHSMDMDEKSREPPHKILKITELADESATQQSTLDKKLSTKLEQGKYQRMGSTKAKETLPQELHTRIDPGDPKHDTSAACSKNSTYDAGAAQQSEQLLSARLRVRDDPDNFAAQSTCTHIDTAKNYAQTETTNVRMRVRDEADIYAEAWAVTFRKLSAEQQIYAKRGIEELLMHGQLGNLSIDSIQIRQRTRQPRQFYAEQVSTTNAAQTRSDVEVLTSNLVVKEEGDVAEFEEILSLS